MGDSSSSGSIVVGLEDTRADEIIVTALGPAPPYPFPGGRVTTEIPSVVTMENPEAVVTVPSLVSLDTDVAVDTPDARAAGNDQRPPSPFGDWPQVPPYANDVRAERRRRAREAVRHRHRGIHAGPVRVPAVEFDDRLWVEYAFPCPQCRRYYANASYLQDWGRGTVKLGGV